MKSYKITADVETLMKQAPMTVHLYLGHAIEMIDEKFGEGYAKENPVLTAAFVQACASDFNTSINNAVRQELAEEAAGREI